MSGLFGSTLIKGTKITDFSGTSAEVGRAIPFGYGAFPVDGFIGWAPLPPVEHRQVKRQGKGGVKQETFTYTLSYGVWFCKGRIYGVKWIKRNGKVVYTTDPNAPLEDREYAAKWAQRVNFHWGTRDQLPDSLIESYEGVGNVSGFPDSFYFTIEDEDVTDNGGAPPNYEACVVATPPEAYLTSKPYPALTEDAASYWLSLQSGVLRTLLHATSVNDGAAYGLSLTGGQLRDPLLIVELPEEGAVYSLSLNGGSMRQPLVRVDTQSNGANYVLSAVNGELREALLTGRVENSAANYSLTLSGGTLT